MKTIAINIETVMGNEIQPSAQTMSHIQEMWSDNTGGGCMVDFIELEGGKILSINEETVCFSESYDQWSLGSPLETIYISGRKHLNNLLTENGYKNIEYGNEVPEGSHIYIVANNLIVEANRIMGKLQDVAFDQDELKNSVCEQIIVWYRG